MKILTFEKRSFRLKNVQSGDEVNGYTEPPLVHAPVDLVIAGHMQNQPIRNAFLNTDIIRVIQNGIPIEFS